MSSPMISNHFWWFEILEFLFFFLSFSMFNASFLFILFVWFALCLMGLDLRIVISEFHFELPKEFLEFFYNSRNSIFSIGFVIKTSAI
jgi:hypothetical protein